MLTFFYFLKNAENVRIQNAVVRYQPNSFLFILYNILAIALTGFYFNFMSYFLHTSQKTLIALI